MLEKVLILDFGSQYTQLIARRVRELNIYCEIFPFNNNKYKISDYKALILSGSPYSVRSEDSLKINIDKKAQELILNICNNSIRQLINYLEKFKILNVKIN